MRAISLGYHDVSDDAPKGSARPAIVLYTIKRQVFRDHLKHIRAQEAPIGTIRRFHRWEGEAPRFLTFDDGSLSTYSCVAYELERYNWRGHFFIVTDWIGRPGFLNRLQILELHERGHVIGSHSCSHPARMSRLNWKELRKEWSESCAILSDTLGEQVRVASVPDGFYSRHVGQAAAAAGIEVLFTSEPTSATSMVDGCLILGRYFIKMHTPSIVSGAIAAGQVWPRWQQRIHWEAKKAVKALTGEFYFAIRRYLISRVLPEATVPHGEGDSPQSLSAGLHENNGMGGPTTRK